MTTFKKSDALGKQGERIIFNYLRGKSWNVVDCAHHRLFQELDIDAVVEKDNVTYTIDIKTDSYDSGNIAIETISNDVKGTKGCLYVTRADYWWYYLIKRDEVLVFKPKDVISLIESKDYRRFSHNTEVGGRHAYTSHGVLVPITDVPVTQTINLEGLDYA